MSIIGSIPTSRVSDSYTRQTLLTQLDSDQTALTKLQQELSTGQAFSLPSQDPSAALSGITANSLVQQNTQVETNLSLSQSYLSESESVLGSASSLLSSVNSTALGAIGTTATPSTVSAALDSVNAALNQLIELGNTNFNGQYLFAGSETGTPPFQLVNGNVQYVGNDNAINTYSSPTTLIQANITGDQAFGAISAGVQSDVNLTPSLTSSTALADLNSGQGIDAGSIARFERDELVGRQSERRGDDWRRGPVVGTQPTRGKHDHGDRHQHRLGRATQRRRKPHDQRSRQRHHGRAVGYPAHECCQSHQHGRRRKLESHARRYHAAVESAGLEGHGDRLFARPGERHHRASQPERRSNTTAQRSTW